MGLKGEDNCPMAAGVGVFGTGVFDGFFLFGVEGTSLLLSETGSFCLVVFFLFLLPFVFASETDIAGFARISSFNTASLRRADLLVDIFRDFEQRLKIERGRVVFALKDEGRGCLIARVKIFGVVESERIAPIT